MRNNTVRWMLAPYTRGKGIHVGAGDEKYYPHFVGVDTEPGGMVDLVAPLGETGFKDEWFDFVVASVEPTEEAIKEWLRVLKPGGYLCIESLAEPIVDATLIKKSAHLAVFRKGLHEVKPKPEKTCAIVRFGAWGDMIQASSILPQLKRMGYHITVYTQPRGYEVMKHEPLIDEFVLLDPDQVPNLWLTDYFNFLETQYDRFINLCESVEGTFLIPPERPLAFWPKEARHAVCDQNYTEITHLLAGVRYVRPEMRFVATDEERQWATAELEKIGGSHRIMWVLAGSSFHKVYPHMDAVIARILLRYPGAQIIFSGDDLCKMLEEPWREEPRIHRMSGQWSIRESLAVAQQCDLVIGPETGIMSAVAMLPMPKVVLLSHSSVVNLTKDWNNTYSVHSTKTACWPCHKLILKKEQCVADEKTGVSQCQSDIPPDAVWHATLAALEPEKTHKRRAA